MLLKEYDSRRVLSSVIERMPELPGSTLTEANWSICRKNSEFLEPVANETEDKSRSKYLTLSTTAKFKRIIKSCALPLVL